MSERQKRATLSKGRASWCAIFRHPVVKTPDGQSLRVRRGLGTKDESEAKELVGQLNEILAEPAYWTLAARKRADQAFDEKIVAAFYDHMEPPQRNHWAEREEVIALPGGKGVEDGYARALFMGTTGAGKTTLVRQLLGTNPSTERFPSTSAAKTTVCDIELVFDNGPFRAVVSFFERDLIRQYITDCVIAAVSSSAEGQSKKHVERRFLTHADQRFRLGYLLGTPATVGTDDELEDEDDEDTLFDDSDIALTDEDREVLQATLRKYFEAIESLAGRYRGRLLEVARNLNIDLNKATRPERDAMEEIIEDELLRDEALHTLVDEIMDDVESRFEQLQDGETVCGRDGWPLRWEWECADRAKFIATVNRFSSNFAPHFGTLLTPLVEGIRVAGPFTPAWTTGGDLPRLVLMDGQGLGHTADTLSSVSTRITSRYQIADAIILVDNAAQPMQAATSGAIESLVTSGHEDKLLLCFTHFDEVKGDNLAGTTAKKDHVLGSLENVITTISKSQGRQAERSLRMAIPDRVFFVSNIHKPLSKGARHTRRELDRLVDGVMNMIVPAGPIEYKPVYDVANLVLAVQAGGHEFHDRWKGLLSLGSRSGVAPEHWTRIKALTRRLGIFRVDEYDNLKPVADLIRILQNHLSGFLAEPLGWHPVPPPEEEDGHQAAVDEIRKEVFRRLHELSRRRVLDERFSGWVEAYEHRGEGSTRRRAKDIVSLYEGAAPVPNEMPGPDANEFLFEIRELVADAIRSAGGHLKGWTREDAVSTGA